MTDNIFHSLPPFLYFVIGNRLAPREPPEPSSCCKAVALLIPKASFGLATAKSRLATDDVTGDGLSDMFKGRSLPVAE
jgi:hypothetical protein